MIKRKRRNQPLYSMEQICRKNGVNYDSSHSSEGIPLIDSDGKIYVIGALDNIFECKYPSYYEDYSISIKSFFYNSTIPSNSSEIDKKFNYKKDDDISQKTEINYNSNSNIIKSNLFYKNIYTVA